MTKRPNFRANITTRYGLPERSTYEQVIKLAKRTNIPRSRMQLILVKQGLKYLNHSERRSK